MERDWWWKISTARYTLQSLFLAHDQGKVADPCFSININIYQKIFSSRKHFPSVQSYPKPPASFGKIYPTNSQACSSTFHINEIWLMKSSFCLKNFFFFLQINKTQKNLPSWPPSYFRMEKVFMLRIHTFTQWFE